MLLVLAIPAWAGSIQVSGAGFVSFGSGRGHAIGYGVDVGLAYLIGGSNYPAVTPTMGPFARFAWGAARGAAAGARGGARWMSPQLGETCTTAYATTQVELGAAIHGERPAAPYLGALSSVGWPAYGPYAQGRLSWEFSRDAAVRTSGDVGLGAQLTFGPWSCAVAGRPLRDRGALLLPAALASSRASLALVHAARAEWASVPAFLRLSAELRALGAPRSLVGRSLAAARDEVRHAADCMAMAGAPVWLGRLPLLPPRAGPRRAWLSLLIGESELDGVIGEGAAADRLADRASSCRNDATARRLARMATEERAHADLAKDVVSWCRQESGLRSQQPEQT